MPASIQPHGVLLVLESGTERVAAAAGNLESLLDTAEDPIGRSLESLIGSSLSELTKGTGFRPGQEPLLLGTLSAASDSGSDCNGLDILAHERDGQVIVELEPSPQDRPSAARLLASLRAGVARIKEATTLDEACREAAEAVRALTGFDRVVAYKFLEDGSGKVVAEAGAETLGSLLNQHFPASDIPVQARALYCRNLVRAIPDVNYVPAAIAPQAAGDLDMSDCALRSVSPVHIQYLKNMGVTSSMSVSIVLKTCLWGLIACHGSRRVLVPYEMREACKHVGAALAQQIEVVETDERAREAERLAHRREDLLANLAGADSAEAEVKRRLAQILALVPASGILVCHRGAVAAHGVTPSPEQALALCAWVRRRDSDAPYSTHALSRDYPPALAYADRASGLLAISAGGEEPLDILWLRPEYVETIEWAGRPGKEEGGGDPSTPLTPRHSFAVWHESVQGFARPWAGAEIFAAQRLRDGIERIRERQRLNSLQAEVIHMSRVNAMGAMASAIAHELNQPLTIIRNYTAGMSRMLERGGDADPEMVDILNRVSDQSLRAGDIIRHLRRLVSNEAALLTPTSVAEVVESACSIALLDASRAGVTTSLAVPPDLVVLADSVQVQQVIMNLVRNALDAMDGIEDGRERRLEITAVRLPDAFVQLTVGDSGPGLTEEVRDKLFSTFNSNKEEGLGIGLSICRTIVEAHGGRIWADEPDRGGTAFSFTLQEGVGPG